MKIATVRVRCLIRDAIVVACPRDRLTDIVARGGLRRFFAGLT